MPGVSWIAAGFVGDSAWELEEAAESLAKAYLRRGDRFSVEAEATGGVTATDLEGTITSRILGSVRGTRVSESPKVRFHVASDGPKGVVGVEVRAGAGGVPTGEDMASCLVSGGIHSSVVAWWALLAGFRVRLKHAMVSDDSVLAVARLYSELSNRADPRGLSLEILRGTSVPDMVAQLASGREGEVFSGFHSSGGAPPGWMRGAVFSPLYLLPEEGYKAEFGSLNIRPFDNVSSWTRRGPSKHTSEKFSGGPADVSAVLDGLR